jgi:predicted regulator of Ras-like GTPase activity (Roadblock/LC7/MglB family)
MGATSMSEQYAEAKHIHHMLSQLVHSHLGVIQAALVSCDGRVLTSARWPRVPDLAPNLASIVRAFTLAFDAVERLHAGTPHHLSMQLEHAVLMMAPSTDATWVVVQTTTDGDLDEAAWQTTRLAQEAREFLTPEIRQHLAADQHG